MTAAARTRAAMTAAARTAAAVTAALAMATACDDDASGARTGAAELPAGETRTETTELGPVKATVAITPAEARLGDPLVLVLTVVAHPGVRVELPSFGEALGRFQIAEFVPRETIDDQGNTVATQRYTLQAPMSGRQRIPPLRIEFVDERPAQAVRAGQAGHAAAGQAGVADADAGAAGAAGAATVQELLTEELAIQVASVLPDGAVAAELRPARGPLSTAPGRSIWATPWPWVAAGALALALAAWLAVRLRRAARRQARISAYDAAIERLRALEQRGLPAPGEADAWYVDLSAIIRRYLEDRFGLRAPELTTEEFLREARRSGRLDPAHRDLLTSFLTACDRVKFARYEPDADESRASLASARRFLEETRAVAPEPPTPPDAAGGRDDQEAAAA